MSYSFELGREKYKLEGNPTLGTVREVQGMQTELLLDYLDEEDLRQMESLEDESEIIQAIIDSGGIEAFEEVQWRRSLLESRQTICLAADEKFTPEQFENMPANTFREVLEESKEALGGVDASGFFNELGVGMSLSEEQMNKVQ